MRNPGIPPASLADKAVSAALWGVNIAWMATCIPPIAALMKVVPSDRIEPVTRFFTRGQVALTLCRWKAVVDPAIDNDRPYMFVQNHVNVLDHCTMYTCTPHFKQGMELRKHFKVPLYGWFMEGRGTIPVDPGTPDNRDNLRRNSQAELNRGHSLLVFPEGTRTRDGHVGTFREGVFHLAQQLGVAIVPVAVTGMWEVLPTGSWVMRPFQEVTVHATAPIETAHLTPEDVPALAAQAQARISAIVDAYYAERARQAEGATR